MKKLGAHVKYNFEVTLVALALVAVLCPLMLLWLYFMLVESVTNMRQAIVKWASDVVVKPVVDRYTRLRTIILDPSERLIDMVGLSLMTIFVAAFSYSIATLVSIIAH